MIHLIVSGHLALCHVDCYLLAFFLCLSVLFNTCCAKDDVSCSTSEHEFIVLEVRLGNLILFARRIGPVWRKLGISEAIYTKLVEFFM